MKIFFSLIALTFISTSCTHTNRSISSIDEQVTKGSGGQYMCPLSHPLAKSIPINERLNVGGELHLKATFEKGKECTQVKDGCELCRSASDKKEIRLSPFKIKSNSFSDSSDDMAAFEECVDNQIKFGSFGRIDQTPTLPNYPQSEGLIQQYIFARSGFYPRFNANVSYQKLIYGPYAGTFDALAQSIKAKCTRRGASTRIGMSRIQIELEDGYRIMCEKGVNFSHVDSKGGKQILSPENDELRGRYSKSFLLATQRQLLHFVENLMEKSGKNDDELLSDFGLSLNDGSDHSYSARLNRQERAAASHYLTSEIPFNRYRKVSVSEHFDQHRIRRLNLEKNIKVPCESLDIDVTEGRSGSNTSI